MKTNWQIKKLDQICEILIGGTPSRGISEYWEGGTLPWVSIRDMSREGSVINNTNERITEKGAKESNVKLIPKGSLLFSFKLSIGKLAIAGSDLYTNEAIAALVIKDENKLNKKFLQYYISQMVFDDVTTAVKGSTLNKEKIKNLEIPVPPLETQKEIVEKLDEKFAKLREAKKLREEAIIDTEKILSQTLRGIFEEGKHKGWEELFFGNEKYLKIIDGDRGKNYPTKSEFTSEGYCLFLSTSNVRKGYFDFTRMDFISKEKDQSLRKGKISRGDVILTTRGTLGNSAFYDDHIPYDNIRINSGMVVLRPDQSRVLSQYIIYIINSNEFIKKIQEANSGSAQPQLPIKVLSNLSFPLPLLSEQQKIVTKLDKLSEKIKSLKELQTSQLADIKSLEKSYLREAFNGKLI